MIPPSPLDDVTVRLSGVLWDRAVDSIGHEHPGYGRQGAWTYRKRGFGGTLTTAMPREDAEAVLLYIEAIARLDGSGMDPEGAAETRREAAAAKIAASALRRELDR